MKPPRCRQTWELFPWMLLVLISIWVFGVELANPYSIKAQDQKLEVVIGLPNEGESFYAGPSSLLYNIPVYGWVKGYDSNPSEISLLLEIIQDGEILEFYEGYPFLDGTFKFSATVNPNHAVGRFDRIDGEYDPTKLACGACCHYPTNIKLPPGNVHLHLTAKSPSGEIAKTERQITIDLADYATIPVQVVVDGGQDKNLSGIPISGSTWLYMWRTRYFRGVTDEFGRVDMLVEALADSPTQYSFYVESSIVNGELYESLGSVEVTLSPGAKTAPLITVHVAKHQNIVVGNLVGVDLPPPDDLSVLAVKLPDGDSYRTSISSQGEFIFLDLPLDQYLFALENSVLFQKGFFGHSRFVDLTLLAEPVISISVEPIEGLSIQGVIIDEEDKPIPFAWINGLDQAYGAGVSPHSGKFRLFDVPSGRQKLIASAPGFYSQAITIGKAPNPDVLTINLSERPDTRHIKWGNGTIYVPAPSLADVNEDHLSLARGWVWGHGGASDPFLIHTRIADIAVYQGKFALEYIPGTRAWFYLFDGNAQLITSDLSVNTALEAGEMVNLFNNTGFVPIRYDPVVVDVLMMNNEVRIEAIWEPSIITQIQGHLTRISIRIAQVVTFSVSFLVLMTLVVAPVWFLYWWRRLRCNSEKLRDD
jgi:hypothetical protein